MFTARYGLGVYIYIYIYIYSCVCVCVIQIQFLLWRAVTMEVLDSTRNKYAAFSRTGAFEGPLS